MAVWKEYKIGDLCDTISETYRGHDEEVILINTSDVLEGRILNHQKVPNRNVKGQFKKTFKTQDILYSEIRPENNRFAYVDMKDTSLYIASTKLMVIRANIEIIEPRFLYAILTAKSMTQELQVRAELRSGTFPQITFKTELATIKVCVPDRNTQKKIVSFLDAINRKIEVNNKINRNLQEQAKAIFEQELLKVEKIPPSWKKGSLIDIAEFLNGLAMQKFRPGDGEIAIPVLKIKELRQGSCDSSSDVCSSKIKSEYIIHDGNVIFSWSGSLLVDFWCGGECGLNQHLFKVSSKKFDRWFYYAWTLYHLDRFIAVASDKATTMGHIKRDELSKAEVLIPDELDYRRIGKMMEPIYDMIISNRIANRKLAILRDQLIPNLMSGKIDVSDIEK